MPEPAPVIRFPAPQDVPSCAQCHTPMSLCCVDDAKMAGASLLTYRCGECGLLDTVLKAKPGPSDRPVGAMGADL